LVTPSVSSWTYASKKEETSPKPEPATTETGK
jgi:hypothetical protein